MLARSAMAGPSLQRLGLRSELRLLTMDTDANWNPWKMRWEVRLGRKASCLSHKYTAVSYSWDITLREKVQLDASLGPNQPNPNEDDF